MEMSQCADSYKWNFPDKLHLQLKAEDFNVHDNVVSAHDSYTKAISSSSNEHM